MLCDWRIPGADSKQTRMTALLAKDMGIVVGTLEQVPNQPLYFTVGDFVSWYFKIFFQICIDTRKRLSAMNKSDPLTPKAIHYRWILFLAGRLDKRRTSRRWNNSLDRVQVHRAVQNKHYGAQLLSFVPNDKGKCKSFRTNAAKSMKPHPRGQQVSHQMWICGILCKQTSKHASKVSILALNPPVLDFWRRLASISDPTTRIDVLLNFF